jgi:hypothetical protein
MRRPGAVVALVIGLTSTAALLAGCGLDPSPAPATPSPSTVAPASPSTPLGSTSPSPSPSPSVSVAGSPGGSVAADPGLFAVIGGDSDQLDFRYDSDTTASVGTDPGVAADAKGLAIGLYTVRGQQPVTDYGIVSILQLRDPGRNEDWFRAYRDSYDESACAQAGGVARHAQTVMSGHTVFIAGCAGGAFTYHLRSRDGALVVSITSVGPADLGSRLAADVDQP